MLKEFREFALKGNMIDIAIGVIIGGAFSNLVNSIVNDIMMPIIGFITGGIDFSNMFIQLSGEKKAILSAAKEAGATISYGHFITILINFFIIAWVLFILVKVINKIRHKQEEVEKPKKISSEEKLLTEIRDLLAEKK
ncbi:large conductance mechanosensitive channel protein MscL [Bartonella sp. F02]|uniref:large conductance mechanosensitive channel protein MscL n=1 Tax=Bartonella sp. F02 TaxID=2967262 RepID=UPI0022A94682|nr:large conductance mechanosensitive channel protein MscL [Bartonella sp. F02]MCZ2328908.1 large conductance mechanosensitive channel protein MscL [Bartonella sp. F02]